MQPINAIILAGERPGGDPLARAFGEPAKALIRVGGEPMVERVVQAVLSHPAVASVRIFTHRPDLITPLFNDDRVTVIASETTIAATLRPLIETACGPLLVTTADNPLIDVNILDEFFRQAKGADLAVGLVERRTLLARYPSSRRTWLKFRGGAYSGANLFWIGGPSILPVLDIWGNVEQQRKRGRALIAAFGPLLLAGVALRLLSLQAALDRVGRRFHLSIRAAVLPQAEACMDVDSARDHALAEYILANHSRP